MPHTGTVISTNSSTDGGIPKFQKDFIEIYKYGVVGDFHSGKYNFHANKNNINRQITIVSNEILKLINESIGEKLFPGSLGENILVEGLGYLENIENGTKIKFGKNVILEITDQNQPCSTLNSIDKRILKLIIGKRGLLAKVINTGMIKKGDKVQIYSE
tara:strand:- start:244 stop:720 length:477 start_codon:yes stop_codon:yes gene_type:complete